MKKLISVLLAFLLLTQSASVVFAYIPEEQYHMSKEQIKHYCSFGFTQDICSGYKKWGKNVQAAWEDYDYAYVTPDLTDYWKETPSDLFKKYESVSKDISDLWEINPEYEDMQLGLTIGKVLFVWDVTFIAVLAGAIIGPALAKAGFPMAGNMANFLPNAVGSVGRVATAAGIKGFFRGLLAKMATGRFWADLGITFGVIVADALYTEGAIYVFGQATQEANAYLAEHKTHKAAIKQRDLLQEIMGYNLTAKQKEEFQDNAKEIQKLQDQVREKFKKSLNEQNTWGDMTDTQAYLLHREAVVSLYALEYIRAEMADVSNGFRYREAAYDLINLYFSEDLTNLPDREELYSFVEDAYMEELRQYEVEMHRRMVIQNAGLPLDSKYVPPFHVGHHM